MHSYNREQSSSSYPHNILTSIMEERKIPLQAALDDLALRAKSHIRRFLHNQSRLPLIAAQLGWSAEIQERLQEYVDGLGQWVRGNDDWSFESARYHGREGQTIRETRLVRLREKRNDGYARKEAVILSGKQNVHRMSWRRLLATSSSISSWHFVGILLMSFSWYCLYPRLW